jgi:hypothetical protein
MIQNSLATLKQEFVDTFAETASFQNLAAQLENLWVKIRDFDRVVYSGLPFGGAVVAHGTPGFSGAYAVLLDSEKEDLKQFYLQQVEQAEKRFPKVRENFPKIF